MASRRQQSKKPRSNQHDCIVEKPRVVVQLLAGHGIATEAQAHCYTWVVGGRLGSRLTTIEELSSLINPSAPFGGAELSPGIPSTSGDELLAFDDISRWWRCCVVRASGQRQPRLWQRHDGASAYATRPYQLKEGRHHGSPPESPLYAV